MSLRIFRVMIVEEAPMRQEPAYEEPGDSNQDPCELGHFRVPSLPVASGGGRGSGQGSGLWWPGGSTLTGASGGTAPVGGRGPRFPGCSCGFFSGITRTRILQWFNSCLGFDYGWFIFIEFP